MKHWAHKIGAQFYIIDTIKFPDWPITYEKFQIYELAEKRGDDWSLYLDADALVHPETLDWTVYLPPDTVAHNGIDFANIRWRYDKYFIRDGRNIGSCNWNTIASSLCRDIWRPLDDLTPEEAIDAIHPIVPEWNSGVFDRSHLIDDYVCSRNIARFGLKCSTLLQIQEKLGFDKDSTAFYWHAYAVTNETKIKDMKARLGPGTPERPTWNLPDFIRNTK